MKGFEMVVAFSILALGVGVSFSTFFSPSRQGTMRESEKTVKIEDLITTGTFTVVEPQETVRGDSIGIVIVKRDSDGSRFRALVIPPREIAMDSKIEIERIQYSPSLHVPPIWIWLVK